MIDAEDDALSIDLELDGNAVQKNSLLRTKPPTAKGLGDALFQSVKAVSDEHADVLLVKFAISVRLSDIETWSYRRDAAFTVAGMVNDRWVDGIPRFLFCLAALARKLV